VGQWVIAGLSQLFLQPCLLLSFLANTFLQLEDFVLQLPDLHLGGKFLSFHAGQLFLLGCLGLPQSQQLHLVATGHGCHFFLQQPVDARTADGVLEAGGTVLAGEKWPGETGGAMCGLLSCDGVARNVEGFFGWYFDAHFGIAYGVFAMSGLATLPLHYCYFIIK
jgi:hypothetical protein